MPEEMFDVVNDHDEVISQESRSVVHRTGLQHRGVHICLFTPDGRMLFQQRSSTRHASPSSLDCSVSEHVKAGEDYLAAAQRGLQEELGLPPRELEPIVKFRMQYGVNDNEICVLYRGRLQDAASVRFDPEEVESVSQAPLDQLQQMRTSGTQAFSRWFDQMLRWVAGQPNDLEIMAQYGELEAY